MYLAHCLLVVFLGFFKYFLDHSYLLYGYKSIAKVYYNLCFFLS